MGKVTLYMKDRTEHGHHVHAFPSAKVLYRGTSLIRNRRPLGPYSRTMPRALRGSKGGGRFLMSEVPL